MIDIKFTDIPYLQILGMGSESTTMNIEREVHFQRFEMADKLWTWSKFADKYLSHIKNISTLMGGKKEEEEEAYVIGAPTLIRREQSDRSRSITTLIITLPHEEMGGYYEDEDDDTATMVQLKVNKVISELLCLELKEIFPGSIFEEQSSVGSYSQNPSFEVTQAPTSNLRESRVELYVSVKPLEEGAVGSGLMTRGLDPVQTLKAFIEHAHKNKSWPERVRLLARAISIKFAKT